jgi:hypothetical protein
MKVTVYVLLHYRRLITCMLRPFFNPKKNLFDNHPIGGLPYFWVLLVAGSKNRHSYICFPCVSYIYTYIYIYMFLMPISVAAWSKA